MEMKVERLEDEIKQLEREKDFTNYAIQTVMLITKVFELVIAVASVIKLMNS